jgi:hypothetical protein
MDGSVVLVDALANSRMNCEFNGVGAPFQCLELADSHGGDTSEFENFVNKNIQLTLFYDSFSMRQPPTNPSFGSDFAAGGCHTSIGNEKCNLYTSTKPRCGIWPETIGYPYQCLIFLHLSTIWHGNS